MSAFRSDGEKWIWAAVYGAAAIAERPVQACEDAADVVITVLRARVKRGEGGAMLREMLGECPPSQGGERGQLRRGEGL